MWEKLSKNGNKLENMAHIGDDDTKSMEIEKKRTSGGIDERED